MVDNVRASGIRKSLFPAKTTVLTGASFDYFTSGVNYQITFDNFKTALGVTGTIATAGAITGTPVLQTIGTANAIRNLENGAGAKATLSPENGITLAHNFTIDSTGTPLMKDPAALSPTFRSIVGVAGGGVAVSISADGNSVELDASAGGLANRIIVTQASDLSGTIDSTKEYFIDGIIDMGTQSVEVPVGGINLSGYNFDLSRLISSASSYTMFTSPVGGSGNMLGKDYALEVTGGSSQAYNVVSATGNEAFEFARINYNNCTSLGTIDNYRQGLEVGTGRFGGSPSLTLKGVWAGGYFIDTSIVRSLDAGMTTALYAAGAGFTMGSRFRSNQNIDLPASASFCDFAPANMLNPSTLQLESCIITRNGVTNPLDSNILPNITNAAVESRFNANIGIENTFEGGMSDVTTEIATVIGATNTFVDLAGTYTASELQHFDSPANGQMRHIGNDPRSYKVTVEMIIAGPANDVISVKIVKWDDSASSFVDVFEQPRQINSLSGARNVAFFTLISNTQLDQNDFIKLQVENQTTTGNLTAELTSFFVVERR